MRIDKLEHIDRFAINARVTLEHDDTKAPGTPVKVFDASVRALTGSVRRGHGRRPLRGHRCRDEKDRTADPQTPKQIQGAQAHGRFDHETPPPGSGGLGTSDTGKQATAGSFGNLSCRVVTRTSFIARFAFGVQLFLKTSAPPKTHRLPMRARGFAGDASRHRGRSGRDCRKSNRLDGTMEAIFAASSSPRGGLGRQRFCFLG